MDEINNFYKTATELYSSSLRALEQRSNAFLLTQSILVSAFAILFYYFQSDINLALFVPTLGIILIGFVFSLVFYCSHQVTSKDAAFWRAYMRFLEGKFSTKNNDSSQEGPWQTFYKYVDNKEGKGFGTRGEAAKKLPAPILWLISPAIFCVAWIWAILWTIQLFAHSSDSGTWFWLWVTLGILFSIAIIVHTICRWQKAKDNIYKEIQELVKQNNKE